MVEINEGNDKISNLCKSLRKSINNCRDSPITLLPFAHIVQSTSRLVHSVRTIKLKPDLDQFCLIDNTVVDWDWFPQFVNMSEMWYS